MEDGRLLIGEEACLRIRFQAARLFRLYRGCAARRCRRARYCQFTTRDRRRPGCHDLLDEDHGMLLDALTDLAALHYHFAATRDITVLDFFQTTPRGEVEEIAIRLAWLAAPPATPEFRNLEKAFAALQKREMDHSGTVCHHETTAAVDGNPLSSP